MSLKKAADINTLRFGFLEKSDEKQSIHLIASGFVSMNSIWKRLGITYEEAEEIMGKRIRYCIGFGLSVVMRVPESGQIAMLATGMDLIDYIKERGYSEQEQTPENNKMQKYAWWQDIRVLATELEKEYFLNMNPEKGECIYGDVGSSLPQYVTRWNTFFFWTYGFIHFKYLGFKTWFGRSSNPISTRIVLKLGGQRVKKVHFKRKGMEDQYMELMKLDLTKIKVTSISKL